MKIQDFRFVRPEALQATAPPEARGLRRDEVRLMVSSSKGHIHAKFTELPCFFRGGDLLVVNRSATLAASLPAEGNIGGFLLNLCTNYGNGFWLAEPRWNTAKPGPLPMESGETVLVGGTPVRMVAPYPGLPRLWFVRFETNAEMLMRNYGKPIRYGYVEEAYPLEAYQTLFGTIPGSAEMPSAARPFTSEVVVGLEARGVEIAGITLHTGVSSLEIEADKVENQPMYPEPFHVSTETAEAVNATVSGGRRIIAVGTTVIRALESAWDGSSVRPTEGFTRRYIEPGRGIHVADGLLTGLHDPLTTHLAMLYALTHPKFVREAYHEAVNAGYLWHEFGDSHLILRRPFQ